MEISIIKSTLSGYRGMHAVYSIYCALSPSGDDTEVPLTIRKRIGVIKAWLDMLSDEECFVVTKHLIDKLPWPLVVIEYERRWGAVQCRNERTLKRAQAKAITQIQEFIVESGRASEMEALFHITEQANENVTFLSLPESIETR